MKILLIIPALCLLSFGCNRNDCCNGNSVQSQENTADWSITTQVKASIMSDTSISATARFVSVSTTNGVVTLTGSVPTREDRDIIVRLAKDVRGVVRVDNRITISNS